MFVLNQKMTKFLVYQTNFTLKNAAVSATKNFLSNHIKIIIVRRLFIQEIRKKNSKYYIN